MAGARDRSPTRWIVSVVPKRPEWQAAAEALMMAAEDRGPLVLVPCIAQQRVPDDGFQSRGCFVELR
jgi:hypothetical protein